MRSTIKLCTLLVAACTTQQKQQTPTRGVARVSETSEITIAFTSDEFKGRIDEILAGSQPRDFHWSSIRMPTSSHDALYSANGAVIDLANATPGVQFSQVYMETCNPAKEDFTRCWIYETYLAGSDGLTGSIHLRLTDTQATGSYEISWHGDTDRFGPPVQSYAHETVANLGAALDSGGTPQ